eukprot:m.729803 g.729803  ORF g.729803 m.729803 type:complete len:74 (-) comp23050_c0_seq41:377-598(-)
MGEQYLCPKRGDATNVTASSRKRWHISSESTVPIPAGISTFFVTRPIHVQTDVHAVTSKTRILDRSSRAIRRI